MVHDPRVDTMEHVVDKLMEEIEDLDKRLANVENFLWDLRQNLEQNT